MGNWGCGGKGMEEMDLLAGLWEQEGPHTALHCGPLHSRPPGCVPAQGQWLWLPGVDLKAPVVF